MVETVQRYFDHTFPLFRCHAGEWGVIVNTGVVDQHLDWPGGKQLGERRTTRLRVGDIKGHGFGRTAGSANFTRHNLRLLLVAVGVDDHMQTVTCQTPANGRADAAAAAGDQGALHPGTPADKSFAANRPFNTVWVPARISNS